MGKQKTASYRGKQRHSNAYQPPCDFVSLFSLIKHKFYFKELLVRICRMRNADHILLLKASVSLLAGEASAHDSVPLTAYQGRLVKGQHV